MTQMFRAWEKEHRSTRQPIYGMTAHLDEAMSAQSGLAGMDGVMMKPVDMAQIRELYQRHKGDPQEEETESRDAEPVVVEDDTTDSATDNHQDALLVVDDTSY